MIEDKVRKRIMAFLIFILAMLLLAAASFIFRNVIARIIFRR